MWEGHPTHNSKHNVSPSEQSDKEMLQRLEMLEDELESAARIIATGTAEIDQDEEGWGSEIEEEFERQELEEQRDKEAMRHIMKFSNGSLHVMVQKVYYLDLTIRNIEWPVTSH